MNSQFIECTIDAAAEAKKGENAFRKLPKNPGRKKEKDWDTRSERTSASSFALESMFAVVESCREVIHRVNSHSGPHYHLPEDPHGSKKLRAQLVGNLKEKTPG